ncbi:MAG: DUF2017 family protein [Acidimicrobiales bacterium]
MSFRRRVRPAREGGYELRLPPAERALLAVLPLQLVSLLEKSGDKTSNELPPALRRLLPTAYTTDPDAERSFVAMTRDDLLEHHRESLETMAATAEATRISEEQLVAWLAALNDLRLSLGSMLGATEDETEPPAAQSQPAEWLAYMYLGGLQSELIDILEGTLPDPVPGADDLVPEDLWGEPPGGLRWDGTPQPRDQ